jgi:hypothetical protein
MADWTEITNAAGEVVGWTSAPDSDEPDVDYFEADRLPKVRRRADAIDQAADLLLDGAFDPSDTWDACEAAGMPEGAIDSAGNVALLLSRVERQARA